MKKLGFYLALAVAFGFAAKPLFACTIQCVSCGNSDGTCTVCRDFGGGKWQCQNVPASQAPEEE